MGNIILYSNSPIIRKSLWARTFETGSFYGSRRMKASLERQGMTVSRKRVGTQSSPVRPFRRQRRLAGRPGAGA